MGQLGLSQEANNNFVLKGVEKKEEVVKSQNDAQMTVTETEDDIQQSLNMKASQDPYDNVEKVTIDDSDGDAEIIDDEDDMQVVKRN